MNFAGVNVEVKLGHRGQTAQKCSDFAGSEVQTVQAIGIKQNASDISKDLIEFGDAIFHTASAPDCLHIDLYLLTVYTKGKTIIGNSGTSYKHKKNKDFWKGVNNNIF
eukprot:TRINITY_DN59548_c0_g1_i1.p2 TRINITY_DN59548_c0_g1~~TRINITY_DN59548_c0_g1_i1.p2  ORF type:complete len:108 (+),score=10.21 TRINITY_DN59548_c0_g1_i1:440-763(+)